LLNDRGKRSAIGAICEPSGKIIWDGSSSGLLLASDIWDDFSFGISVGSKIIGILRKVMLAALLRNTRV
jgi:hypothetical protein